MPVYAAVDLGAESGRVLVGTMVDDRVSVRETHRFANRAIRVPDGLYWDILALYGQAADGLAASVAGASDHVASIGIDGWGNDFALLDDTGALLGNPRHYRDGRTVGMTQRIAERMGHQEIFRRTGVLSQSINTSCQLLAMEGSTLVREARRLLLLPDLLTYWLTGEVVTERTIASTTQLLALDGEWATDVIARLGLPGGLFHGPVVQPGTEVGPVRHDVAADWRCHVAPRVVAVAEHDTACAVAAVPAETPAFAYISCGTWSLVGVEVREPITSEAARRAGFTNEAGVGGTVRFLHNGTGLWLLQECRRLWASGQQAPSYEDLTRRAATVASFVSLIDPNHPMFLTVGDMPDRIRRYCQRTGQTPPADHAAVVRCILESLAMAYRRALETAQELSGLSVDVLHLVGGGAANALLCQLTADVTRRPVVAGPEEATGVGNLLIQAWTDGRIGSLAELRSVVARSFTLRRYEPKAGPDQIDEAYERFRRVANAASDAYVTTAAGGI
jgi:rhamnulokinase